MALHWINLYKTTMMLFLALFVPVLTFTLKDNMIKDDPVMNKRNLKSLSSNHADLKVAPSFQQVFGIYPTHQRRKHKRKQERGKRHRNKNSNHSQKEMEEERALQRAITFTNPMVPLKFRDTVKKRPKRKNLKPERLLRKMGEDFNSNWMAINISHTQNGEKIVEMSQDQMSKLLEQVDDLNLEHELRTLISDDSSKFAIKTTQIQSVPGPENIPDRDAGAEITKMASIFKQWLVRKSVCPTTFTWIDLGIYFWPRWIKVGACAADELMPKMNDYSTQGKDNLIQNNKRSNNCSWPKGMQCGPDAAETLQILRWHCRKRRRLGTTHQTRKRHIHKCKWYKVPYPVTSSCKCSSK